MRQRILITLLIFTLLITGCNRGDTPPPEKSPTQVKSTMTASPSPTSTTIPTPTTTITPSPSFTPPPQPTQTPTVSVTPTPLAISPANAGGLQRDAVYTLPVRGRLQEAKWSQDGKLVLAVTDIGTYILDDSSLKQIKFFKGMTLITELEGNEWLVWSDGQRKYLYLENNDYRLLPADNRFNELGTDLISRNGELAVRKTSEDEVELVWLQTGKQQTFNISEAGYHLKYMRPMMISPDSKVLIIQDTYWSDLYFVNLETLEVAFKLNRIYDDPVFSPDGQYVLVQDNAGIRALKTRNGIQTNRFSDGFIIRPTKQSYIYYRAMLYNYLPDSQRVGVIYCIENQRCELYIWSMATGQPEQIVKGLPAGISVLDFTPSGEDFLTLSNEGKVETWSIEKQVKLAESQPFDRTQPVISSDGRLAAIPRGSRIEVYNVVTGELWKEVGDYQGLISLQVDSITDNYLMVAGVDSSYRSFSELWDLSSGELVRKLKPLGSPNTYTNETFCTRDQQGKLIACGSSTLQIFDGKTGELLYSNKSQEGTLTWALSPDGNTLATCTVVYTPDTNQAIPGDRIFMLDLSKSTSLISGVLEAPKGGICSPMIFSPDNQYLAAQSGYIWKLGEKQPQASFTGEVKAPIAFSPDSSLLISGNQVIETDTGKTLAVLKTDGPVEMIGFNPDGYHLVLETNQGVEIWKVSGDWKPGSTGKNGYAVSSWTPYPTPALYDDFAGENLNLALWDPSDSSGSSGFLFNQRGGVLTMQSKNPVSMNGLDLHLIKPTKRRIDQVRVFEARLQVGNESRGYGFAKIQVFADIPGLSWWTQCRLGNDLVPGGITFLCDVDSIQNGAISIEHTTSSIKAEYDRWYLLRIEFNPDVGGIQYYLDGQLLETYIPQNSSELMKTMFIPSIGVWSTNTTTLVANIDDVRISGAP